MSELAITGQGIQIALIVISILQPIAIGLISWLLLTVHNLSVELARVCTELNNLKEQVELAHKRISKITNSKTEKS
jgi:hypothetical protein